MENFKDNFLRNVSRHININLFNFFFIIISLLLVYLLFINSFIYRYDIGSNLDDKITTAISSKYIFNKLDGKSELYDELVNQCNNHPVNVKLCYQRYQYRGDTLANYVIPSILTKNDPLRICLIRST